MVESPRIHNSQRVAVGRPPMDIGEVFSLCSMRGQNWGGSCLSACGQESGLDHPSPSPYTNSNHFLFFAMENNRIWRRWMYLPNWGTSMNFFFFWKSRFPTIWSWSSNGCICLSTVPSLNNEETAQIILGHSIHHNANSLSKCSLHKTSLINGFYIHRFYLLFSVDEICFKLPSLFGFRAALNYSLNFSVR